MTQGYINQVEHSGRKTGDNMEFSCSVPAAAVTRIWGGRPAARQPACRIPMARPAFPTHSYVGFPIFAKMNA